MGTNFISKLKKTYFGGQPEGPPTGHRRHVAAARVPHAGGIHPCARGTPLAPSDAYKIPLNLKTLGMMIIFHRNLPEAAAIFNPNSGGS